MSDQWDDRLFQDFIRLRDALRAAKKAKEYRRVLSLGLSILELDKTATFLRIATPVFLKDMAEACIGLSDITSAIGYLIAARSGLKERQVNPGDWRKDIEVIDRKLEKLKAVVNQTRSGNGC